MTPQEAEDRRCVIAYGIAKEICEKTQSYREALYIAEKAADMIKLSRDTEEAKVLPHPTNRYGKKVELPETEAPGNQQ